MFSLGSCVLTLDPQLVVVFWEVAEHLGDGALLEVVPEGRSWDLQPSPASCPLCFLISLEVLPPEPQAVLATEPSPPGKTIFPLTKWYISSLKLLYPDLITKMRRVADPWEK